MWGFDGPAVARFVQDNTTKKPLRWCKNRLQKKYNCKEKTEQIRKGYGIVSKSTVLPRHVLCTCVQRKTTRSEKRDREQNKYRNTKPVGEAFIRQTVRYILPGACEAATQEKCCRKAKCFTGISLPSQNFFSEQSNKKGRP